MNCQFGTSETQPPMKIMKKYLRFIPNHFRTKAPAADSPAPPRCRAKLCGAPQGASCVHVSSRKNKRRIWAHDHDCHGRFQNVGILISKQYVVIRTGSHHKRKVGKKEAYVGMTPSTSHCLWKACEAVFKPPKSDM